MAFRRRDIEALIKATEKAIKGVENINKKYPEKYKDVAYLTCDSIITKWYDSYSPIFYEPYRRGSLYKMFKVELDGRNLIVDIDGEGLDGLSRYLYELTFMEGYHGGAKNGTIKIKNEKGDVIKEIPHPSPKVPYWKTPFPYYTNWGRPAIKTFSPYNRIMLELSKEMEKIDKEKQEEYDKLVNKMRAIISRFE